ncbi:NAD(P)-dependent dehydrogenase (short-subunit alcohol dehydrogenase family) [Bradyrhizobium sp. USDA 3315]
MARLAGKTCLITAAAQEIGRASALACAVEGTHVIGTDINTEALSSLAAQDSRIAVHQLDVLSSAAVAEFAWSQEELDGLFNCAGYVYEGTILGCSEANWTSAST